MPKTSELRIEQIRKKLPAGAKLPSSFGRLMEDKLPVDIRWTSLAQYELKSSASKEAVPFLALGDGGIICFWFHGDPAPIVHIGAHGEVEVVAANFDAFLRDINSRRTGISDLDEADEPIRIPGVRKAATRKKHKKLQVQLQEWFESHSALQKPLKASTSDALRRRFVRIAKAMLKKGLSKVYSAKDDDWSMTFRAQRTGSRLKLTYLDYGEWYDVPASYGLEATINEVLALVKHPKRKQFEIEVTVDGLVSVDRDKELVLVPDNFLL
jgi:hypothetical protein